MHAWGKTVFNDILNVKLKPIIRAGLKKKYMDKHLEFILCFDTDISSTRFGKDRCQIYFTRYF